MESENFVDMQLLRAEMSSVTRVGEECTEEVRELIDVCMRTNVDERPSAMDIVHRLQVPSLFICSLLCNLHVRPMFFGKVLCDFCQHICASQSLATFSKPWGKQR